VVGLLERLQRLRPKASQSLARLLSLMASFMERTPAHVQHCSTDICRCRLWHMCTAAIRTVHVPEEKQTPAR